MGWLIALGILMLIAFLPIGASIIYDSDGLILHLLLGAIRVKLFPKQKKRVSREKPKKPEKKKQQGTQKSKTATKKKSGGSLLDFLPIVNHVLEFLGKFRTKLRINRLELKLTMAGDDPCDLAVNYGKAWTALGNLMPQLERFFVIKKRDLEVQCDFTATDTVIYARLDVTITVGRIFHLAGVYGFRILREFFNIMKLRKGGNAT